jgi:hypothetical protein
MANLSALEQIDKLNEEHRQKVEKLRQDALAELETEKLRLEGEIKEVNRKIGALTGKKARAAKGSAKAAGKMVSFDRLKDLLNESPSKSFRVRDQGLDLGCVRKLADEHEELVIGGKHPWYSVKLKK